MTADRRIYSNKVLSNMGFDDMELVSREFSWTPWSSWSTAEI